MEFLIRCGQLPSRSQDLMELVNHEASPLEQLQPKTPPSTPTPPPSELSAMVRQSTAPTANLEDLIDSCLCDPRGSRPLGPVSKLQHVVRISIVRRSGHQDVWSHRCSQGVDITAVHFMELHVAYTVQQSPHHTCGRSRPNSTPCYNGIIAKLRQCIPQCHGVDNTRCLRRSYCAARRVYFEEDGPTCTRLAFYIDVI